MHKLNQYMRKIIGKFYKLLFKTTYPPLIEQETRFLTLIKNLNCSNLYYKYKNDIFYIPVRSLGALTEESFVVESHALISRHAKNNKIILFDLSIESVVDLIDFFYKNLEKYKLPLDRIVLLCANNDAKKYHENYIQKYYKAAKPIKMIGYDFYLYEFFYEVSISEYFKRNHSLILNKIKNATFNNMLRPYYYMTLNLKPRAHRTLLLLYLISKNYLNKGVVTYFSQEFGKFEDTQTLIESVDTDLLKWVPKLEELSPITFERDADEMKKDLWIRRPGQVEFLIPEIKENPNFDNFKSYFEIVTETWLVDEYMTYITEKTLRPILRLQPFIHIGPPNHLKHLRELGFKTFSPFINEAYDEVVDKKQRLKMIFAEIDRLLAMDIKTLHESYKAIWPVLEYNYQFFYNNVGKLFPKVANNLFYEITGTY